MKIFKKTYLKEKLTPGFVSLYTGKMIVQLSQGIGGLFLPIFLFKIFDLKIEYVIYYYIANSFAYLISVAYGAKFLNKIGFRRSLRMSVFFGALYYLLFYFANKENIFLILILAIIVLTFFRLFYWLPYHVDFAKFTTKESRGKQFSLLEATRLLIGVISPLMFGFLIKEFNFEAMFLIGILIYLISGIPYIFITRTREKFSWTYKQTWKEFFSKKNRDTILAYIGDGAENTIGTIIWPIFIWELLKGNVFSVGAISSLIVMVTIIMQLALGKYTDKVNKKKILHWGSFFYSLGWIAKVFVVSGFQIFITATYHNLSRIFFRTPLDVLTYEMAADEGHYVDEFTVIHEMAISMGKILMLILVLITTFFVSIQWTFVLAAIFALMVNFIKFNPLKR